LPEQTRDGLPFRRGLRFSVDRNVDHAWLTPLFSTHYSQI
jgi:hypothetical protein